MVSDRTAVSAGDARRLGRRDRAGGGRARRAVMPSIAEKSIRGCAAAQVGLDQELRAAAEAHTIDLQIFEHALHIVARLRERDALHPIDRIELAVPRTAQALHPVTHPPPP